MLSAKGLYTLSEELLCRLFQFPPFLCIVVASVSVINALHHIYGEQSVPVAEKTDPPRIFRFLDTTEYHAIMGANLLWRYISV